MRNQLATVILDGSENLMGIGSSEYVAWENLLQTLRATGGHGDCVRQLKLQGFYAEDVVIRSQIKVEDITVAA